MEMNTITIPDFVRLADMLWERAYKSVPQSMISSGMVKVSNIPQNTGNTREFSEIDTNEYLPLKGESDQAARAQVQQGYSKIMSMERHAENMGISYEMRTQNKYPEVVQRLTGAGRKGANTIDLDLSHRLTFMTATTYADSNGRTISITVGDGLALLSTAHTLNGSATTFRNQLANNPKLSKAALEGIERLVVEETYNQLGEVMTTPFDILWTTNDPNSVNTAREYLQSTADVTGAHAGIVNVYQGKYKHVILPRVATTATGGADTDKRYYWGLASSEYSTFHLGMWEQPRMIAPQAGSNAEDVQNDDWDFRIRTGFGIVIVSGTWLKASKGDDSV